MSKLHRRHFVCAAGLGALVASARFGTGALNSSTSLDAHGLGAHKKFSRASHALGTKVTITVLHPDKLHAEAGLNAAFAAIEEVESHLSIYRSDSQLRRLNEFGFLSRPHADLIAVLECAQETSRRSHGAFDVTVQPLWEQFEAAQRQGRHPTAIEIADARAHVGWQRVQFSSDEVRLHGRGTKLTLNGIAQGYAADRALSALRIHGIEHALIDTGELASLGSKLSGEGWQVGIQHPRQPEAFIALAKLKDRCLSTSGDYATSFSSDHRIHHVFDPATGLSPSELASVSIAAPTAMQADAWSTAALVLGSKRAAELLRSLPDHDALFVLKDGHSLVTPGFPLDDEGAV